LKDEQADLGFWLTVHSEQWDAMREDYATLLEELQAREGRPATTPPQALRRARRAPPTPANGSSAVAVKPVATVARRVEPADVVRRIAARHVERSRHERF